MVRIYGPKRGELTGCYWKLYVDEYYNLYSISGIVRARASMGIQWDGHVASVEQTVTPYKISIGKSERKSPFLKSYVLTLG